mgnify:CR=1 FL=1
MQRTPQNLELYQQVCKQVMERADNMCEILVDDDRSACSNKEKHRCLKYIPFDNVTYTNFLHTETRNGKNDEWVLNPKNIILGCALHHLEEERTGIRVERCSYDEISYIPVNE